MASLAHDPVVILAARGAFALLFASAAWHKLSDRAAFATLLAAYRVVPAAVVPVAGVGIAVIELATAAAWLAPGALVYAVRATVALLAAYAIAIAVNLARGRRTIDCGCGVGGAAQPIGEGLVVRNVLLALAAWLTMAATIGPVVSVPMASGLADRSGGRTALDDEGRTVAGEGASGSVDSSGVSSPQAGSGRASSWRVTPPSGGRAPRPLLWIDALTVAGVVAVVAAVWTAAHGLAAAAARVRVVDARHAERHGADA